MGPLNGKNLTNRISTSKIKNIKEIIKNGIENVTSVPLNGWNPHSKAPPLCVKVLRSPSLNTTITIKRRPVIIAKIQ